MRPAVDSDRPKTLRQQIFQSSGSAIGAATSLKVEFLSRIGKWAAAEVPPLGALLGSRLASTCESAGVLGPVELCQRCESFLVPDVNCEEVANATGKPKAAGPAACACKYCGYRNSKARPTKPEKSKLAGTSRSSKVVAAQGSGKVVASTLNDKLVANKAVSSPGTGTTPQPSGKKRKRKGWTSLKDLAGMTPQKPEQAKVSTPLPKKKMRER